MEILNPIDPDKIRSAFTGSVTPFPNVVIDNFLKPEVAQEQFAAISQYLNQRRESFVKYEQAWEKLKFTDNKLEQMPAVTAGLLKTFNSAPFLRQLEGLTGLKNLVPDDGYWGGGIHATYPTGKLNVHHDFTILPTSYGQPEELQRVLNLIVYLNPNWQKEWAGELELWDHGMTACLKQIEPQFNRAVIFHTFESNHGQPDPYRGPDDQPRISLATYYYQKVRPGHIERRSTLYQVRPGEVETEAETALRLARADAKRYSKGS